MTLQNKFTVRLAPLLLFLPALLAGCTAAPATEAAPTPTMAQIQTAVPTDTLLPSPEPAPTEAANEALQATSTAVPTAAPATPTEPAPLETAISQPLLEDEVAIVYKRSGGRAGVDEEYTIYRSGRITTKDGQEWWADPQDVDRLLQELEDLGFYEMASQYIPKDTCCDRFFYELSVQSGGQANTVATIDAAPGAPDELWAALNLLQQFLERTKPQ